MIEGVQDIVRYAKNRSPADTKSDVAIIDEAIKIRQIISSFNVSGYFKTLRSEKTNYLFCCLMLIFYKNMLEEAVIELKDSHWKSEKMTFPFELLA